MLFEGFESTRIATPGADLHVRTGGNGPPLLLLHGYPQTGAMWHAVAPALARQFTVVIPDLPGYGASSKPPSSRDHAPFSKRAMAASIVHAMVAFGFERWQLAGHDRGARVAYRMALDHPQRVERLATLDAVPTLSTWEAMDWRAAMASYHWLFLAQPAPLPETLIAADPLFYLHNTLARWAAPAFQFDPTALAEYEQAFLDPETVRACCEDYRAGATIDYELDAADFGKRKIECPMLALWGARPGRPPRDMLATWRDWAVDVRGGPLACGHFLAEEAPDDVAREFEAFFGP